MELSQEAYDALKKTYRAFVLGGIRGFRTGGLYNSTLTQFCVLGRAIHSGAITKSSYETIYEDRYVLEWDVVVQELAKKDIVTPDCYRLFDVNDTHGYAKTRDVLEYMLRNYAPKPIENPTGPDPEDVKVPTFDREKTPVAV